MKKEDAPEWQNDYANVRMDVYVMLAALLREAPSKRLLEILTDMQWEDSIPDKLERAFAILREAGRDYRLEAIVDEYNRLFVGLGSGEIVPYASWYKEKKIQSMPLASLRADLMKLGIVRQTNWHESEDHAGALCEIMAIMSQTPNVVPRAAQTKFFEQHIASWMTGLFKDIQSAKSAGFYRTVGLFGQRLLETEKEFLQCDEKGQKFITEGELQNGDQLFERPANIH